MDIDKLTECVDSWVRDTYKDPDDVRLALEVVSAYSHRLRAALLSKQQGGGVSMDKLFVCNDCDNDSPCMLIMVNYSDTDGVPDGCASAAGSANWKDQSNPPNVPNGAGNKGVEMSVQRFNACHCDEPGPEMFKNDNGKYVFYTDYAALERERDKLRKQVDLFHGALLRQEKAGRREIRK